MKKFYSNFFLHCNVPLKLILTDLKISFACDWASADSNTPADSVARDDTWTPDCTSLGTSEVGKNYYGSPASSCRKKFEDFYSCLFVLGLTDLGIVNIWARQKVETVTDHNWRFLQSNHCIWNIWNVII